LFGLIFLCSFGSGERTEEPGTFKQTPGPGTYPLNSMFDGKNKGPTLISRRPDSALTLNAKVPGPGAYDPSLNYKKKAPGFRMGSAPRSSVDREQASKPGPGNYPLPVRRGTGVRFGSSVRPSLNDPTFAPGPGAYPLNLSTNYGPKV